jgi:hypothetical protein
MSWFSKRWSSISYWPVGVVVLFFLLVGFPLTLAIVVATAHAIAKVEAFYRIESGSLASSAGTAPSVRVTTTASGCPSHAAGNVIVISCPDQPAFAAHLAGVRVEQSQSVRVVLEEISTHLPPSRHPADCAADNRGNPSRKSDCQEVDATLLCSAYDVQAADADVSSLGIERLALCKFGMVDPSLVALRSGHGVLASEGTLSRAFLENVNLLKEYEAAERAARQEGTGLWWDYPAGRSPQDVDPLRWRAYEGARQPNESASMISLQTWVATLLVLGGGIVSFQHEYRLGQLVRDARWTRIRQRLQKHAKQVRSDIGNGEWEAAALDAAKVESLLESSGASDESLQRWHTLQSSIGAKETGAAKRDLDKFESMIDKDEAFRWVVSALEESKS